MGLGDVLVAAAGFLGRSGLPGVEALYWPGIVLIYLVPTGAAVFCRNDRRSVLLLVTLLVAALYLINVLNSPLRLSTTDELQTLRSLIDLDRSHHLFFPNPLVTSYPRFPGSQIVFVTIHQLTGLSLASSSRIIIALEELLLGYALFNLVEQIFGSPLAAYSAVLVYATNPSYVYFDSQVFYESFALPLAVVTLLLVALAARSSQRRDRRFFLGLATLLGIVVCLSHHLTSYWLAAVLIIWSLIAEIHNLFARPTNAQTPPWLPAIATATFAGLWYALVAADQVTHELGPVFDNATHAVRAILTGSGPPKVPFSSPSTLPALNDPLALQAFGYASVLVAAAIIVAGLYHFNRAHPVPTLLFSLLALLYPVGIAFRLTAASTETSSRSNEFTFLGLAVLSGLIVAAHTSQLGGRHFTRNAHPRRGPLLLATSLLASAVLAVGGIVVGQAPYDRVAGTYLAGADFRSVEPLGLETAQWATTNWAAGAKLAADPTNTRLIASTGDFLPEDGFIHGDPVNHLFLSPTIDPEDWVIIDGDKINYIILDQRLTVLPSATGPAFGGSEPGVKVTPSAPVPVRDFAKFASSDEFSRVYDDGTIRIYMTPVSRTYS
jgi:hypothetical protein